PSVAASATSTTALPNLTFEFTPDFAVTPTQTSPVPNQQFNISNLFYWTNVIHDVFYNYGFTEAGGNFQEDNLGRGGVGGDYLKAEAQDGSGTNNANFATPPDGSRPTMQMYLWTLSTPQRDGDVDHGIVTHEHGHGIGKRVTGGPANTGCLSSAETQGEGISDYFGLMLTQDWSTATLTTGFDSPRGVGMYALNQPQNGPGIRPKRYTTNFAINGDTYANLPGQAIPHGVGYLWCTMLWEMTWEVINDVGSISPNIYDNTAPGGNIVALNLVMEGLRIQPCQPGFVDAKNAILQADMNLYGGVHQCAIIRAFARRGVGVNALQGSVSSINDQTPDFTGGGPVMEFTQNGAAGIPEGQNIIYNHAITANCEALSNYTLRDTLPLNVNFVSATNGGTYNGATRVVSWPVNLAVNATGNYGLTVQIAPGSYFPPNVLIDEPVPTTTISPFWTEASTTTNHWIAHNVRSHSAPNSFFSPDVSVNSDQTLTTTNSIALGANPPTLSFWHRYEFEGTSFDGAVLEISTDGGSNWSDIGEANIVQNGYTGTISSSFGSVLAGRRAWTGDATTFKETIVNMTPYANQANVKLRWRMASDNSIGDVGWNVDDIKLQEIAQVNMRSNLFDDLDVRVDYQDTVTVILPPSGPVNPTVTIDQAVAQADPTSNTPINFTVVFDQPVTGFATGDVDLSSSTAPGTLVGTVTGTGTTYNVAVSGMTGDGTVIATIPANVCVNTNSDPNLASTSTDNSVTWNLVPANDLCANAIPIACGSTTLGTTVNATTDAGVPICSGVSVTSPGVWYTFTGNGGNVTLSLCTGTTYDSKISVYSGSCGSLVCVGADDDGCGVFAGPSTVTVPTTNGTTYHVLVHGFGGATGPFELTLDCCPTLSVDPVADQTVCAGASTTAVHFTGMEPATVYSWTNDNTAIGLAASGNGDIASFTATNATNAPIVANITVTPTYSGCPDGTPTTFKITVNPTPNTTATPDAQTVCSGSAITPIVLTSNVSGASFSWTRDNAGITGIAMSGNGNIMGSLTNNGTATVTVTFTITASANGCSGPSTTATVDVLPTPTVNPIADQTVCNGEMTAPVNFTSAVPGVTYNWTNSNTAIGLAASGTGDIAAFTATNATLVPITGTITVTPQLVLPGAVTFSGSLLPGDPTLGYRINRNGVVSSCASPKTWPGNFGSGPYFYDTYSLTNNTGADQCVTVDYQSSTGNFVHVSAYNGSFDPSNQAANYLADGGTSAGTSPLSFSFTAPAGSTIVFVVFDPNNTTVPGYTVTVNGLPTTCSGPTESFDITVNPTPTITCPTNITVPSPVGACSLPVNYTPTVTGTPAPTLSYVLTGATTGSGAGSGSGSTFNVGVTTVTITATNICDVVSCSFTVTVTDSQLPTVTDQPDDATVCVGSNAVFSV
ncbi:MAG: M36 family metallopeptidase, partial [Chitinophagaceae bacterium]|nr:M36 family metallopeptidase [Chitinophagaceae bacterium]